MLARVTPATTLHDALLRPPVAPSSPALIGHDDAVLTFEALRERVDQRRSELELPARSIVVMDGRNSIEWVVTYLALLSDRHVPVLAGSNGRELTAVWDPQAIVGIDGDVVRIERTGSTVTPLHDDLALLVSTSGSTGSPKLVRLSHRNLVSNAASIAEFQRLTAADRGITSLPLHYCFGLSVLHSHLLVGAGLVVTDGSVVDPCFRRSMHLHGVTNLAGVPHTYEMMDRVGADEFAGASLRLLTQAGGRMPAEQVSTWLGRADRWGAEFMVMYGQTEATARIAYLPPAVAARRPGAVGRPIPGGRLTLDTELAHLPETERGAAVGELLYEGPNVMMGYASAPADLALDPASAPLRTGDLARFHADDGVYEIVGRRSRFVKPFGVRIDLDDLQARLRDEFGDVGVAGDDERLVVFVGDVVGRRGRSRRLEAAVRSNVVEITGLPSARILVVCAAPPRTATGKIDGPAMLATAQTAAPPTNVEHESSAARVFGDVLGVDRVGRDDSFVSLGGDSLSYVESSIRLERVLGHLPTDWHLLTVAELDRSRGRPRRLSRIDTTVVLRAVGICMVVATHMRLWHVPGGAHTLLAVAGYNVARFLTPIESPLGRLRAGVTTAARAAIPTMVWVGVGMAVFGSYSLGTLLLVNNYVGPASHADDHWHFWFIEVFVHLVLAATVLLTIPAVGRIDRRWRFVVPGTLLAVALVARMEWAHLDDWYNLRFRTHGVAWFFALGWSIQRSSATWQRVVVTVVCLATIPGFFRIAEREWRIAALLLLLVWVRQLPMPSAAIRPIGVLAAASMWIYISHFTFWPLLDDVFVREVAYVATIALGVGVWFVAERLLGLLNTWRQGRSPVPLDPATTPITTPTTVLRGTA